MSDLARIAVALAAAVVLMVAIWLVQRARKNAGIVDVAWSFATGLAGAFFALTGDGAPGRRWLVAGMALVWAARLGAYLARRVASEEEDGRYRALRRKWGARTQPYLFVFFLAQAVVAVLFALPMLVAAANAAPFPAWYDLAAAALFVLAIAGETVADRQLARFRRRPENRGRVCRDGLWAWSRHPNYFGEIVLWVGVALIALPVLAGWQLVTLVSPLFVALLLTRVSGIPMLERKADERWGGQADYEAYKAATPVLLPRPPRQPRRGA